MTETDKIAMVKAITKEADDTTVSAYLSRAASIIINKAYPYADDKPLPPRYDNLQVDIAVYLLNKRGAEGESAHNENGINRTYESASVPDSMLAEVVPHVGTFGGRRPPNAMLGA